MTAACALMTAARPAFKNVGLTSWKTQQPETSTSTTSTIHNNKKSDQHNHVEKYIVAIWGDEGLDMPLCMPNGCPLVPLPASSATTRAANSSLSSSDEESSSLWTSWLAQLVNERHERNWNKIA
jgi:Methyltransferase TYW3